VAGVSTQPEPTVETVDADAQALFEEARRRTRRRHRRQAAALGLTLALLGGAGWLAAGDGGDGGDGETGSGDARPQITALMPSQIFEREPYMGVSCKTANSIACDRIGLAVWTKDPARSVVATIAGRTFKLQWGAGGFCCRPQDRSNRVRRQFIGFLHHAGLRGPGPLKVHIENRRNRFTAARPTIARARIVVTYPDGSRRSVTMRLSLAPGWG
jgi:hypothetical protein